MVIPRIGLALGWWVTANLAIALLSVPVDAAPREERYLQVTGVRSDDVLNVRRKPSAKTKIVGALWSSERCLHVVSDKPGWFQIKRPANDQRQELEGWVRGTYVEAMSSSICKDTAAAAPAPLAVHALPPLPPVGPPSEDFLKQRGMAMDPDYDGLMGKRTETLTVEGLGKLEVALACGWEPFMHEKHWMCSAVLSSSGKKVSVSGLPHRWKSEQGSVLIAASESNCCDSDSVEFVVVSNDLEKLCEWKVSIWSEQGPKGGAARKVWWSTLRSRLRGMLVHPERHVRWRSNGTCEVL